MYAELELANSTMHCMAILYVAGIHWWVHTAREIGVILSYICAGTSPHITIDCSATTFSELSLCKRYQKQYSVQLLFTDLSMSSTWLCSHLNYTQRLMTKCQSCTSSH